MAGFKCRCLFCRHWALDWRRNSWDLEASSRPLWLRSNEHLPQRHPTWSSTLQGLRPTQNNSQSKFLWLFNSVFFWYHESFLYRSVISLVIMRLIIQQCLPSLGCCMKGKLGNVLPQRIIISGKWYLILVSGLETHMLSRCLAHIINLATQALILKRSQTKFYDPEAPDTPVPNILAAHRDEVGLVRAICVKACCF